MKYVLIVLALTFILFLLGQALPMHKMEIKKVSPYECGFDPLKSSRLPFSFRFFLVAILFLIFDLEMALLVPLPFSLIFVYGQGLLVLVLFMLILSFGLYYEWIMGGLEWADK